MTTPASRRLWAATALVTILLLLVTWFLLVSPQRLHLALLRAQRTALAEENGRLRDNVTRLQSSVGDLPARRARLDDLRVRVPEEPRLPELLQSLEEAAAAAGVELVSVAPDSPAPVPTPIPSSATTPAATSSTDSSRRLQQIPLTVVVRGGYVEVAAFLDQIESLPRTVLVSAVTVAAEQAANGTRPPGEGGRVEARLQGRAFVQPPDPLAVGPSPLDPVLPGSSSLGPSSPGPSSPGPTPLPSPALGLAGVKSGPPHADNALRVE